MAARRGLPFGNRGGRKTDSRRDLPQFVVQGIQIWSTLDTLEPSSCTRTSHRLRTPCALAALRESPSSLQDTPGDRGEFPDRPIVRAIAHKPIYLNHLRQIQSGGLESPPSEEESTIRQYAASDGQLHDPHLRGQRKWPSRHLGRNVYRGQPGQDGYGCQCLKWFRYIRALVRHFAAIVDSGNNLLDQHLQRHHNRYG